MEITTAQIVSTGAPTAISVINVNGTSLAAGDPITVNEYAVMAIPAVFRAVNFLAGTLAGLPKSVVKRVGNVYQPIDHSLNRLLARRMNPLTTPFVFWETFYHHDLLWGNGYGLVLRQPGTFTPTAIATLNPETVTPYRVINEDGSRTQWYHVLNLLGNGKHGLVRAADMVHVPGLGFDGMCGYALIDILCETFEWARNVLRFRQRYLKKGTQVQGSIEIPGTVTKEQADLIKQQIRDQHSGMNADYSHMVLSGGAKLNNTTIDPQKSQLSETAADAVVDICRILGVSPWYVYELGRATWGNAEQMASDLVKASLRPWIEKTEEELAAKLLTEKEQDAGLCIRFDVEDLTRGDYKTVSDTTIAQVNAGLLTANEGRARLGMPPSDDSRASKLRMAAPGQQATAQAPIKASRKRKAKTP